MGKNPADFADLLTATIDRWYDSAEAFAAATGGEVSASSVSRWSRRIGRPTMRKLEELQPFIKDDRGRPVPLAYLVGLTYPGAEKAGAASRAVVTQPDHALARELAKMLDDDSPVPAEKREMLAQLVDAVMSPYRTYLRKRKAV